MDSGPFRLSLQLFADGGASGGTGTGPSGGASAGGNASAGGAGRSGVNGQGAAASAKTGGSGAPTESEARRRAKNVGKYEGALENAPRGADKRDAAANAREDRDPAEGGEKRRSFDELIAGEYRQDFDRRMQQIVRARLGETRSAQDRLNQFAPALKLVAERCGLDFSDLSRADPAALLKALQENKGAAANEAARRGDKPEPLWKTMRLAQVQKARADRERAEEARMNENYAQLRAQAEQFRRKEPRFSLDAEMKNETFARMIMDKYPLETAYHVAHLDEIEARRAEAYRTKMREVARMAAQQASNAIRAGARRPTENGTSAAAATVSKIDIRKLDKSAIRDMTARAARGEVFPSSLFT